MWTLECFGLFDYNYFCLCLYCKTVQLHLILSTECTLSLYGFDPKTIVEICHGTLVMDLRSPEQMELLETTCIFLYTFVYLRRFKSTVTYCIVFFLVWGHPHTTQIVVICSKCAVVWQPIANMAVVDAARWCASSRDC